MRVILVKWFGGVEWDTEKFSSFNPSKKKSVTEHLIETGGLDVEEAIESFDKFKDYPLIVTQYKLKSSDINWVTKFVISENDDVKSEKIQSELVENYTKKSAKLATGTSGYSIKIEITTLEELDQINENIKEMALNKDIQ